MPDIPDPLRLALARRYAIEGTLGSGGMATVYLARDLKHDRHVALKVFHSEYAANLGAERFHREIEIAAKLTHPHILPLYDSGESGGFLYYAMPHVEGESLRERITREKQLPFNDAIQIARQVADALSYAHKQGIIHRDIKPENILLEEGEAVVADFGIARAITVAAEDKMTASGIVVGTPQYMSPEQGSGEHELDGRTDVYSLGCVLYEMLTGEPPFTGRTAQAVIAKHIGEHPPTLRVVRPEAPPWLERVVQTALAKTPVDRFQTAQQLSQSLAERTEPRGGLHPSSQKVRRRLAAFAIAASLLALILVVAVALDLLPGALRIPTSAHEPTVTTGADPHKVAVLYFTDRTVDGSLAWLATGLTESLIDRLHETEVLKVVSAAGVRPYVGRDVAPDSIGRVFAVGTVVDGTVDSANTLVRAEISITDPQTGFLVGRFNVERPVDEPRAMEVQISQALANELRPWIGERVALSRERDEATSDSAWIAYQRAKELVGDAEWLEEARDMEAASLRLQRADSLLAWAEQKDPGWLTPTIQRGEITWYHAIVLMATTPSEIASVRADVTRWLNSGIRHSERAMAKQPGDARALELRGRLRLELYKHGVTPQADTLLSAAHADLAAATNADPSFARAWNSFAEVLESLGKYAEARWAVEKALEADVYLADAEDVYVNLYWGALNRGEFDQAGELCETGERTYPHNGNFMECEFTLLAWATGGRADVDRAWQLWAELDTSSLIAQGRLWRHLYVAAVLARAGLRDSARSVIARTRASIQDERDLTNIAAIEAFVWTLLDEYGRAADLLAQELRARPGGESFWANHPWFRELANTEEFRTLLSH